MTPNNALATALESEFGASLTNMPSALLLELHQTTYSRRLGMCLELLPQSAQLIPYYRAIDDLDTDSIKQLEDWLSSLIQNRQDITDTIHQMMYDLTEEVA